MKYSELTTGTQDAIDQTTIPDEEDIEMELIRQSVEFSLMTESKFLSALLDIKTEDRDNIIRERILTIEGGHAQKMANMPFYEISFSRIPVFLKPDFT